MGVALLFLNWFRKQHCIAQTSELPRSIHYFHGIQHPNLQILVWLVGVNIQCANMINDWYWWPVLEWFLVSLPLSKNLIIHSVWKIWQFRFSRTGNCEHIKIGIQYLILVNLCKKSVSETCFNVSIYVHLVFAFWDFYGFKI